MSSTVTEISALLIADVPVSGAISIPTKVGANNISAVIECQSTTRGLVLPRMTTAQRNAIPVPINGMLIYNTTTGTTNTYEGGAWGASGGGDVDGPAASTNQGISVFSGITGKLIQNSTVLLNPVTSVISAIGGIINAIGVATAPSFSFTGDTDTGFYNAAANTIGVATAGVKQLAFSGGATTVNNLNIAGSVTTAPLTITAEGTDATIGISLAPKNNGPVFMNGGSVTNPGLAFNGGGTSTTSGLSLNVGGAARTNWVSTSIGGAAMSAVNGNGVMSLGTTTFDATMVNGVQIAASTDPTGQANTLQIFGAVIGGNSGTLGLRVPAGSVSVSAVNTVNFKVQVNVNGTTMYLLASNAP